MSSQNRASLLGMKYLLFVFLSVLLVACQPPDNAGDATAASSAGVSAAGAPGLQTRLELDGEPALGQLPLTVFVLDENGGVEGASIEIVGDMTHAGMVPVIVEAVESEPGFYRADDFEFTMAGDWLITADIELPNGESTSAEAIVTVPGN